MFEQESWEQFDGEELFSSEKQLHANKRVKIDPVDLKKVNTEGFDLQTSSQEGDIEPPQDGDSYMDASDLEGHVDTLYEMENNQPGVSESQPDVKADKEEDRRTSKEDKAEAEFSEEGQKDSSDQSGMAEQKDQNSSQEEKSEDQTYEQKDGSSEQAEKKEQKTSGE